MIFLAWMSSAVLYWVLSRFLVRPVQRKCYSVEPEDSLRPLFKAIVYSRSWVRNNVNNLWAKHGSHSSTFSVALNIGDGGSFFLACENFGRMFDNSFADCAFFFFLLKVEISSRTLIPLFMPGSVHSASASRDHCDRVFPDELRVRSFPYRFRNNAWTLA